MSKSMFDSFSQAEGQDMSVNAGNVLQNLQKMFSEVEPAVVEIIYEESRGDYDRAFAQLLQQQEESRAVWGGSEVLGEVRTSGYVWSGIGNATMPELINAESEETTSPPTKYSNNQSKRLPKPRPYQPPCTLLHRASLSRAHSLDAAGESHYLLQNEAFRQKGWAPNLSMHTTESSRDAKPSLDGVSALSSLPIAHDMRCNRRKREVADVSGGNLTGASTNNEVRGMSVMSKRSSHQNEGCNGDEGDGLRSLFEAFPSIDIKVIARAYGDCDGDANAAAFQLATLSFNDNKMCRDNAVQSGCESGPLPMHQGKKTLEQLSSLNANSQIHSQKVEAHISQLCLVTDDKLWGKPEIVPGLNQQWMNRREGMQNPPLKQQSSWQGFESSCFQEEEKKREDQDSSERATADFIYSMLGGEDGGVEMSTIRDLLDFFKGDAQKSLETMLNMTNDVGFLDFPAPSMETMPLLSPSMKNEDASLMSLLECYPDLSPERAARVLEEHNGDLEAAATAVLQAEDFEMLAVKAPPVAQQMTESPRTKANLHKLQAEFPTLERQVLREVLSASSISGASDLLRAAGFSPGPCAQPSVHAIMAEEKTAARKFRPLPLDAGTSWSRDDHVGSASNSEDEPSPQGTFAPNGWQMSERNYNRKWEKSGSSSVAVFGSPGQGRGNLQRESNWGSGRSSGEMNIDRYGTLASGPRNEFERQHEVRNQHSRLAKYFFQEAQKAFESGHKMYAAELVTKGKEQKELAKEASRSASQRILTNRSMQHDNQLVLDLHEQLVDEALGQLAIHLEIMSTIGTVRSLVVITGQGRHSQGGVPKVKPAVLAYLQNHGIKWKERNAGCIVVDYEDVISGNSRA